MNTTSEDAEDVWENATIYNSWKRAHTLHPGSIGIADCRRLSNGNSTLRNNSNFDTLKYIVLKTVRKKLQPEESQKLQHLQSQIQQELLIPGTTRATKLIYCINSAPPVGAVGIDYTGHFFVKSNTAGQSKAYVAIFACCITPAVHLELVTVLTVEKILLTFHRFCAGNPFQQQLDRIM